MLNQAATDRIELAKLLDRSGVDVIENFYVKIPASESNINTQKDELAKPYFYTAPAESNTDLILYFAIALVALLFAEWWLHTREQY